ncbi:ATP-binding protein [Streptosporangium sp. NPDC049248]|uniref:ATP-binding protein n=1 Tax=Streptosporangium sp. NPDC049248 TaxID=3155651 RepID=UPI00342E59E7
MAVTVTEAFQRVFRGEAAHVSAARTWTLACLPATYRRADDVALVVTELATNAVLHSASALPGATFTVRLELRQDGVEVTVTDAGAPLVPARRPDADEYGRGLAIVRELAEATIITATPAGGRATSCRFDPCGRR